MSQQQGTQRSLKPQNEQITNISMDSSSYPEQTCFKFVAQVEHTNVNVQLLLKQIDQQDYQTAHLQLISHIVNKNMHLFLFTQEFRSPYQQNCLLPVRIGVKKLAYGFINHVYILSPRVQHKQNNHQFVIKIQKLIQDITKHQIQLHSILQQADPKLRSVVPKLLDHGCFDGIRYLLMNRIPGQRLIKMWPYLSQQQKQLSIFQLGKFMKQLHSIKFKQYSPMRPHVFPSASQALYWYTNKWLQQKWQFANNIKMSKLTISNIKYLKDYLKSNMSILDEQKEGPVFVHNDLHFGNILYAKGTGITGIVDFDFSRQMNRAYQLRHIFQGLENPCKYADQDDLQICIDKLQQKDNWHKLYGRPHLLKYIKIMKRQYPQLFQQKELVTKMRVYLIDGMLNQINEQPSQQKMFNEKVHLYFFTDYLGRWLI